MIESISKKLKNESCFIFIKLKIKAADELREISMLNFYFYKKRVKYCKKIVYENAKEMKKNNTKLH